MERQLLQTALRELQTFLRSPRFWGTFAAVVLIFWITGPYGTATRLAAAPRLGFWFVVHAAAWTCAIVFVVLADTLLASRVANRFARMMCGAVLAAPLIGLVTETIRTATFGGAITLSDYADALLTGLVLSSLFCVLTWLSMSPAGKVRSPLSVKAPTTPPPLLRRLKPENRAPLLHLAVQDHYVEVTTARGRELVLTRFSDALDELGDTPGLRVHRSHWVADAAVATLAREDGRYTIVLKSGTHIPVSRPYVAAARARWGNGDRR